MAISLIATLFFADLSDHLLDTHDEETFRDNAVIDDDFSFFFSAQKEQAAGRFTGELAKWFISLVADEDPGLFHLANIAVHALVSFLLFFVYRSTGIGSRASSLGGLLFLINVAHFQAVHWITQLDYLLGLFFALLAMFCFGRFLDIGAKGWMAGALLAALLAIGAHAGLCVLFPIAFYWASRRHFPVVQTLKWFGGIGLGGIGLVAVIFWQTARDAPVWDVARTLGSAGVLAVLGQSLEHFGLYLSRLFTTAHWIFFPLYKPHPLEPYLGLAMGLVLVWVFYKRTPYLNLWGVWVAIMLIPFCPIAPSGLFQSPTDPSRYLYFASAGSSLLLAHLLDRIARLLPSRFGSLQTAFVGVLFAILAFTSYRALKQTEMLSIYSSARYYNASGNTKNGLERLQAALAGDTAALPLAEVYFHLVNIQLSHAEDPNPTLTEALALFPDDPWLNLSKGLIDQESDEARIYQSGQKHLAASIERAKLQGHTTQLANNLATVLHNIGKSHFLRQDYPHATRAFERALAIRPDKTNTNQALGETYAYLGFQHFQENRYAPAEEAYRKALAINRDNKLARIGLGWLFYYQDRWREAISQHQMVLEHQADIHAQFGLALATLAMGDTSAARAAYAEGVRQFGSEQAREINAVHDLDRLIERSGEAATARDIRATYWPNK
ncbi:MAG: tetratricopeptide repeat protein [Candidatus Latescibacterota bacterium]